VNETDFSVFGTQFTASAVIVFIGHILERWFPKLADVSPNLKRGVYWLIAAGSAIGVHESFTASTGTLVITGLTIGGILHGVWHWVQSLALQEFVHGSTKNGTLPEPPKP
jgi:hypothetical protein